MLKAPLKRRIRHYVREEMHKSNETHLAPEFQLITDPSKLKTERVLWIFVLACCVSVCCYQTYERIEYFFAEPVTVNVAVDEKESINFPELILAGLDQDAYLPFWPLGSDKKPINNTFYCAVPLSMLLRESETARRNLTKLWLASNMTPAIKYLNIAYNDKLLSKVSFGNSAVEYSNNTYFRWREKMALQGLTSIVKIIRPVKVGSKINVVLRKRGSCSFQLLFMLLKHELIPFRYRLYARFGTIVIVTISTKQYNMVNRRKEPCHDFKKVTKCYRRCITKRYKAIKCSFPFLPRDDNLKDCTSADNGTAIIDLYDNITLTTTVTSATLTCGCIKSCTEIVSHVAPQKYIIDDTNVVHIQFDLSDPFVIVFDEQLAYTAIKLAIDIGGNIGLLLGLSLLDFVEISNFSLRYLQRKVAERPIRTIKANPMKLKSLAILSATRKYVGSPESKAKKTFVRLKIIICLLCSTLTLYMISQNILLYMSDSSRIIVVLTESGKIYHPNFVLCGETAEIRMLRNKMSNETNIHPCQLHFLDLLDLKKKKISLDSLWSSTLISLDDLTLAGFQRIHGGQKINVVRNITAMHTGMCHEFSFIPMPYVGEGTAYLFSIEEIQNCNDGLLQLYLRPHNAKIHSILLDQRHLLANFMGQILIRTFTVKQLDIRRHPCVETNEFEDCTNYCKERKIEKLIKCGLPFMENINYSPCQNATTAKESYVTYLKIAFQTDTLKECGCFPACDKTVYQSFFYYDEPGLQSTLHSTFPLTNLIENVIEVPAYNFVGMVCDIGNNIGLSLGLSVLAVLHTTSGVFSKFFVPRE